MLGSVTGSTRTDRPERSRPAAVRPVTENGQRGCPAPIWLWATPLSVVRIQLSSGARRQRLSPYLVAPTHPTCATSAESPSACCQRKKITEITVKKNSPPGIHMINAPIV